VAQFEYTRPEHSVFAASLQQAAMVENVLVGSNSIAVAAVRKHDSLT
jgi:hypothetical protein